MSFEDVAATEGAAHDHRQQKKGELGEQCAEIRRQYTIKGIENETVNLMRTAARKQGMRVGAWVSARLREAADRALQGEDSKWKVEMVELRDHIRRIEDSQREEAERLRAIQDELSGMIRAQHTIMTRILGEV